jgi:hypothetical protein
VNWRWQLVRLQDGRADSAAGSQAAPDPIAGEVFAIHQGLADLRRRIEQAGQVPTRFSVEIRCSATTAARLTGEENSEAADQTTVSGWRAEQARWKSLPFAPVRH